MSRLERRLTPKEFRFTSRHIRDAAQHFLARYRSALTAAPNREWPHSQAAPDATPDQPAREPRGHASWYRGPDCNFFPSKTKLASEGGVEEYILKGWAPERPFIDRDMYITTFGSCFAEHVTTYLYRSGYKVFGRDLKKDSYIIRCGEGLVNTFAIRQQFEWAFGAKDFAETLWHDQYGQALVYDEKVRAITHDILMKTNVFVITLGLSEIWYERETGEAFWRAIPSNQFDPVKHAFKVSTTQENVANLQEIHRLIRAHKPGATIIFTLSPVPLTATFRPVSCITANAVSKAVLRVAVDEFMRENANDRKLFYFPSYEIVKETFDDPYMDDNRHVRDEVIANVMGHFSRAFLVP